MKTAKEMFEALGYECRKSENAIQYLSECGKEITFFFELHRFYKQRNFISLNIELDEFKVILKQMEELGWIEEKPETNYEHYKDEIIEGWMLDLALVDGKLKRCSRVDCNECEFNPGANKGCKQRLIEWLKKPYQKPTYKLTKFEYDLLNAHKDSGMQKCLSNYRPLLELNEKGYFKGIDTKIPIREILDNCKVV